MVSFFLILITGLLIICLHKVRRIHQKLFEVEATRAGLNQLRQMQAYDGLMRETRLERSLPPLGEWAASPDFLLTIAKHVLSAKPTNIVECSSGSSTVVLAQCARENGVGHVFSLEQSIDFAAKTRAELQRHGLEAWATVIDAPLTERITAGQRHLWYQECPLPDAIQMLVVDGPSYAEKPGTLRYYAGPILLPRLMGTAFVDDADRPTDIEMVKRWKVEFPDIAVEYFPLEKGCAVLTR